MRKFFLPLGIFVAFSILGQPSFGGNGTSSAQKVPTFTLDQAILAALQRNPALLNAEQEIKRTKGVIIQVRAQALPQVTARANFEWIDPNLQGARIFGTTSGTGTTPGGTTGAASLIESPPSQVRDIQTPLAAPAPTPTPNIEASDV